MKTPKPILTSVLQIYAAISVVVSVAAGLLAHNQGDTWTAAVTVFVGLANALLALGLGQVVSYLARSAFHAERAADALDRMALAARPAPTRMPTAMPTTVTSSDPDIAAHMAAKRARGE